ncbi:accessory factor UbiK family protein [Magnetococcus sp. PR-3]|uniref:accessory factor UbiK family protein n=1 Tax=Magnetococcus sp. PR-3 TaxID=3120355 RepID=UPI002FCE33D7
MQLDNAFIDRIAQNVLGVVSSVGETREEMIRKVREVVREGVEHFDLVTRDEFEVARKMAANARIQLDALEARVEELEKKLNSESSDES